ncbi:MAG: hypothetical protein ACRDCW_18145 [Sarcina sp.]
MKQKKMKNKGEEYSVKGEKMIENIYSMVIFGGIIWISIGILCQIIDVYMETGSIKEVLEAKKDFIIWLIGMWAMFFVGSKPMRDYMRSFGPIGKPLQIMIILTIAAIILIRPVKFLYGIYKEERSKGRGIKDALLAATLGIDLWD